MHACVSIQSFARTMSSPQRRWQVSMYLKICVYFSCSAKMRKHTVVQTKTTTLHCTSTTNVCKKFLTLMTVGLYLCRALFLQCKNTPQFDYNHARVVLVCVRVCPARPAALPAPGNRKYILDVFEKVNSHFNDPGLTRIIRI